MKSNNLPSCKILELFPFCPGRAWHLSWCGSDLCLWRPGAHPPHPGSCSALLPPAGCPCSAGICGWNVGWWVSIWLFLRLCERIEGVSKWEYYVLYIRNKLIFTRVVSALPCRWYKKGLKKMVLLHYGTGYSV